jgi:hypothetical protein
VPSIPPLSAEQLLAGIKADAASLAACSESAKIRVLMPRRHRIHYLRVRFFVAADGSVKAANVLPTQLAKMPRNVQDCVLQKVRALRFAQSGGAWISYPFAVGKLAKPPSSQPVKPKTKSR